MSSALVGGRPALSVWFTAPRVVDFRDSSAPPPGAGEVRIDALFSGISHGSEMMVYRGEIPSELSLDSSLPTLRGSFGFPVKYGYASVGRVIDAGSGVSGFEEGDLVFAFNPHETCYTVPAAAVIRLPPELDPRAGIFAANVETALNSLLDAAPRLGERIVVIGQGVVGLLITRLARRSGVGLIVTSDLYEKRRRLSQVAGADLAVDPTTESLAQAVSSMTGGVGADIVIEASGQPRALNDAITVAAREGKVVAVSWYGIKSAELALGTDFHRKRLTLKSSQVSSLDPSLMPRWTIARRRQQAVSYLGDSFLDELVSHVLPFNGAAEAYRVIDQQPAEVVQVVLDYRQ